MPRRDDGFTSDEERDAYVQAFWEDDYAAAIAEGAAPPPWLLWAHSRDAWIPDPPLTVAQAAKRANVDHQTIRRRLAHWAAQEPPLAWKVGRVWRILPAALAQMNLDPTPTPPRNSRRRRRAHSGSDSEVW